MYVYYNTYIHGNPKSKPKNSISQTPTFACLRKKTKPPKPQAPELLRTRFSSAQLLRCFHKLLPAGFLASWVDKEFYQRAFTPLVTLWYCIFQRLGPNPHLSNVVEDALEGGADRLSPRDKRLSQQLHS